MSSGYCTEQAKESVNIGHTSFEQQTTSRTGYTCGVRWSFKHRSGVRFDHEQVLPGILELCTRCPLTLALSALVELNSPSF